MTVFPGIIGDQILSAIGQTGLTFLIEETFLSYLLVQVIACVGMVGLFRKMSGRKSWLGIIPGVNYARLGILCGQKALGAIYGFGQLFLGVAFLLLDAYTDENLEIGIYFLVLLSVCTVAIFFLFLLQTVVGIFLFRKLIDKFEESRWWLIAFALIPHLTLLFWGISSRIRE